ncbi:MAG TPA: glycosyltransferase family 4 protein [Vicinamibacterales bacterium]|nr:glycosyltransferase family 4 protein [Vicinamibacterales bacterium]
MAVITIVTSAPPLVEGGHLVLARSLERALRDAGHHAGIVTTPSNRFGRQGPAYLANWLTDVGVTGSGERVDQIISMRFPSYAVRHPRHVCWLVHTMREYYDLWDRFSAGLSPQGRLKERARRGLVRAADTYCFKHHVTRLFTISGAVRDRVAKWNGVPADVLHPPPPQRPYRCDSYGDFLFAPSRLSPLKRLDLVLQALARPEAGGARCVIAGDGEEAERLVRLSRTLGLESRVTFTGRLDEAALVDHLARCRAVVFVPHDEDYGFVTVEAFASAKPVITCQDSGGPLELVRDGSNGWVTAPTPADVAKALAEAAGDAGNAERRGRQGQRDIALLTWPAVVDRLVIV